VLGTALSDPVLGRRMLLTATGDTVGSLGDAGRDAAFVAAVALELASTEKPVMERIDSEGMKEFIDKHGLKGAIEVWGGWDYESGWFEAR